MPYVLRNTDTGKYVAHPGSAHSYVVRLEEARQYPTREAAQQDACVDNERVLSLEEACATVA